MTTRVLAKANIKVPIDVIHRGALAIAYLKRKLLGEDHPVPQLLFLDLKMPGTDGFQVLDWIRQQPRLCR